MIIDVHGHFGYSPSFYNIYPYLKAFVNRLYALGIEKIIISHNQSLQGINFKENAEEIERIYYKSKEMVFGYLVFDPNHSSTCLDLLNKYRNAPFFKGIKIHPSMHKTSADDEKYRRIWQWAKEENLPILTHSWDKSDYNPVQIFSYPDFFEKFVSEYPQVKFILGHSGGRPNGIDQAIKLGKKYSNVYFDLAGDVYMLNLIEKLCSQIGADRILFGSDINWFDPSPQIAMVSKAKINKEEKEKIFYKNAKLLFNF